MRHQHIKFRIKFSILFEIRNARQSEIHSTFLDSFFLLLLNIKRKQKKNKEKSINKYLLVSDLLMIKNHLFLTKTKKKMKPLIFQKENIRFMNVCKIKKLI